MTFTKPIRRTAMSVLENDRTGDLMALAFAVALAILVAALVPL